MANDVKASTVEVVDASGKAVLHIRNDGALLLYKDGVVASLLRQHSLSLGNLGIVDPGVVRLVADDKGGHIFVSNDQQGCRVAIEGNGPSGVVTSIAPGNVQLQVDGKPVIMLLSNGQIVCGTLSCPQIAGEHIRLWHAGQDVIVLDALSGKITCTDVELSNADCAEEFNLEEGSKIDAGTVVILTGEGAVAECREEYDTRVAGVVSRAGTYRPGILLDRQSTTVGRVPVTLMGKVFCKIDATKAPVFPGDLLVSSPLAGHAMKACDRSRLPGSVVGKALGSMQKGTGLLPMLLSLA